MIAEALVAGDIELNVGCCGDVHLDEVDLVMVGSIDVVVVVVGDLVGVLRLALVRKAADWDI